MPESPGDNRVKAIVFVLVAIGFSATQDAITKHMSGEFSAYETVTFRCIGSLPLLVGTLWHQGHLKSLATPMMARIISRGLILCTGYFSFVLSIAAMPLANAVAIYFTMPFFVAALAGPVIGERVRPHRWAAIAAGFAGVLIIVRPGLGVFEPAAILALVSAFSYGLGQLVGRPAAQRIPPPVIAMWQNTIYLTVALVLALIFNHVDLGSIHDKSLLFLSRPWVWPSPMDGAILLGNGVLAAVAMMLFITAYKYGETNFVAPFEYSSMVWAISYGFIFFGDFPDRYSWIGMAIVVIAGILMIRRDRQLDRALA
jgi:drug/metabolite transporter (DMT)-like permease